MAEVVAPVLEVFAGADLALQGIEHFDKLKNELNTAVHNFSQVSNEIGNFMDPHALHQDVLMEMLPSWAPETQRKIDAFMASRKLRQPGPRTRGKSRKRGRDEEKALVVYDPNQASRNKRQKRTELILSPATFTVGSFNKSMAYGKRKSYSSRKKCTKRSVKALIRENAAFGNYVYYRFMSTGFVGNGFNKFGLGKFDFFPPTFFGGGGDLDVLLDNSNFVIPATGGVDQPRPTSLGFQMKKVRHHVQIHSACNEIQKVTIWFCQCKDDTDESTIDAWTNGWVDLIPGSTARGWINNATSTLNEDIQAYPTESTLFKRHWGILKKHSFWLRPGQTVQGYYKGGSHRYKPADQPGNDYIAGLSQCFLIRTDGIPTHQHDVVGASVNTGIVGLSKTGIDVVISTGLNAARPIAPFSLVGSKPDLIQAPPNDLNLSASQTPAAVYNLVADI